MYRKCRRKHWIPSPSLRATASIWPSGLSWLACFKDLASTKIRGNSMISWRKPRPQQSWDSTTESGCLTAPKNLHVRFLVLHLAHTPTKRHAESESHRISTTFWVFSRVIEITEPRIKCIKYLSLFFVSLGAPESCWPLASQTSPKISPSPEDSSASYRRRRRWLQSPTRRSNSRAPATHCDSLAWPCL